MFVHYYWELCWFLYANILSRNLSKLNWKEFFHPEIFLLFFFLSIQRFLWFWDLGLQDHVGWRFCFAFIYFSFPLLLIELMVYMCSHPSCRPIKWSQTLCCWGGSMPVPQQCWCYYWSVTEPVGSLVPFPVVKLRPCPSISQAYRGQPRFTVEEGPPWPLASSWPWPLPHFSWGA